ncbi:dual 3',5'-cyclic-AMP and-GMP phosphodiesterase 11 [Trichonephila clavipes]|nr:dual 3',5'-cyclic-AMP and-GMP phosphodiesterase 11 [Trichonephila clavipes]
MLENKNLSSLSSSLRRFLRPFSVECHYKLPSRTRMIPDRESLRKTIGHLKERFYVDNLVMSVNDVTELEQLKSQSIEIMKEDDPKELKPRKPAHFIHDIKERETFDLDLIDSQHLLKRVRYLHTLRSNLRKRFYKKYLGELVRSPKVVSRRKIISPGEIVIVESKNPNPMNWPLAQVIEFFPGKDGVERVAKLRLASGEII